MGSRTYHPTLRLIAHTLRAYCAKYDATIRTNMSTEVQAVYDALLGALDSLLAILEIPTGS